MRKLRAHERDTGAAAGRRYCQYRRYRRGTRDVAPARCADRGCRARGAALVTGLVLLLVLTILGVAAMSTAALEIVIAGNAQFQHDAFALAENAVDTVIAEGRYARDGARVLEPLGTLETLGADREAVTTFVGATPVTDRAFSVDAVEALHFEVVAEGRGPRNAAVTVVQGFYVIAAKD